MTVQVLHSKASIEGHPIHPMLVGFPIALYTSGLGSLAVYAALHDLFWYRAAMTLWFGGVAMAVLAAIFGIIDLFIGIPREERATRKTGVKHFSLNVLTTIQRHHAGIEDPAEAESSSPSSDALRSPPRPDREPSDARRMTSDHVRQGAMVDLDRDAGRRARPSHRPVG